MNANPASADLYERLGIATDAGQEEIRAAFKAMRKELHPDSRPDSLRDHFNTLMQNVNEANQTLSNPRSRAKYDARRGAASEAQQREQQARRQSEQQQEEDRRREREAEQQRREEEARRAREAEEQARADEEEYWWEDEDDDPARREAPREPAPEAAPVASSAGSFLQKIPGPVHRAMIYVAGSWVWLLTTWAIASLPIWGASIVAFFFAVGTVAAAGVLCLLLLKAGVAIGWLVKVVGFFMPGQRFRALWYSRRIVESAVLAPVLIFVSALASGVYALLSFAAIAYVALWVMEFVGWRRRRQEVGG